MKKTLVLVGILMFAAVMAAGCPCGTAEKNVANKMISDAKAAGAVNDASAGAKLKSAESSFAAADKSAKKLKCKDAKAGYTKAYNEANDAWKTGLANKPAAPCSGGGGTCPKGTHPTK